MAAAMEVVMAKEVIMVKIKAIGEIKEVVAME
jgi:hypothetical protein